MGRAGCGTGPHSHVIGYRPAEAGRTGDGFGGSLGGGSGARCGLSGWGTESTAFTVDHGAVKPAFGYRVDYGPRSVVISGDTTYSSNLVVWAMGADVVIHEVMMASETLLKENPRMQKVEKYHSSPKQAGQILAQIKPKLGILVHMLKFGVTEEHVLEALGKHYKGEVGWGRI